MRRLGDVGEPVTRGRRDVRAAERKALEDALFAAGLFALVVLVNGILAIIAIAFLQAAGLWGGTAEEIEGAASALSELVRVSRLGLTGWL
jgi:hypothetical protein